MTAGERGTAGIGPAGGSPAGTGGAKHRRGGGITGRLRFSSAKREGIGRRILPCRAADAAPRWETHPHRLRGIDSRVPSTRLPVAVGHPRPPAVRGRRGPTRSSRRSTLRRNGGTPPTEPSAPPPPATKGSSGRGEPSFPPTGSAEGMRFPRAEPSFGPADGAVRTEPVPRTADRPRKHRRKKAWSPETRRTGLHPRRKLFPLSGFIGRAAPPPQRGSSASPIPSLSSHFFWISFPSSGFLGRSMA